MADVASVENRLERQRKALKARDPEVVAEVGGARARACRSCRKARRSTAPASTPSRPRQLLAPAFLLTTKPMLVVCNTGEDSRTSPSPIDGRAGGPDRHRGRDRGDRHRSRARRDAGDVRRRESALDQVAGAAYHLLGRRTFLTTGDKESRAWTFRAGAKAPECAGVIHSDLQRGFIRAEVIRWDELLEIGSWSKARDAGKLRVEGKDYEVADGDVLEIRFNV